MWIWSANSGLLSRSSESHSLSIRYQHHSNQGTMEDILQAKLDEYIIEVLIRF